MKKNLKKIIFTLILTIITLTNTHFILAADSPTMDLDKAKPDIELATDPAALTTNIFTLIFVVVAGIAFFFLILGAIAFITSGGDKGKVEDARNKILYTVIGLLILAATWAIFVLITDIGFGGREKLVIPKLNEAGS